MALVIKKRVSLDFLGEEYKDAYLTFKSIPSIKLEELTPELERLENQKTGSSKFIIEIMKEYFIKGESPDENGNLVEVKSEDLDELDPETMLKCFKVFTGQELDPKESEPLTSS